MNNIWFSGLFLSENVANEKSLHTYAHTHTHTLGDL